MAAAVTDETGSGALVFAASPAFTGTPTAPTAPAGTNTTQLATTAHVFAERSNAATLTNKTLTSPTINTPTITGATISGSAISGGTVSGITDLAIADGGTGASTAADALLNFGLTATAAELNTLDGITASTVELNYVDGVTSPIQTQLDGKQSIDPTLTAFANFNTNGLITQIATDTFTGRTLTAGSGVTIINGDGVAGNPTVVVDLASQAEAEAGTDNTKLMTPLRTEQHMLANGLGWGQTWQTVTRSFGTSYQNTTSRPIQVSVKTGGSGSAIQVSPDNATWLTVGQNDSADYGYSSAIIPVNYYYRVTISTPQIWVDVS